MQSLIQRLGIMG